MTQNLIPLAHPADTTATVTSHELLEIVNEERAKAGESTVRHGDFLARCRDELDGDFYETFVLMPEGRGRPSEGIRMNPDQCKLVAMRESKSVRRHVLARLKELEAKTAQPSASVATLSRLDILKLAMEAEEARIKAEAERDHAVATKARIGHQREATAMATASVAVRQVESLKTKLDESQQWATIKRMEMAYHGQKFDWRLLKAASTDLGLKTKPVFDANYGTVNAYHADAWLEAYAIEIL